jgi:hypothetical protein
MGRYRANVADRVTPNNDIIDSRDVIERIDELESELNSLECEACEGHGTVTIPQGREDDGDDEDNCSACGGDGTVDASNVTKEDADKVVAARSLTFLSEFQDELEELWLLRAFLEEMEQNAGEGVQHGVVAVRDSYFERYARQEAEDCGLIKDDATWPNNCIDWTEAARQLQQDYSCIDYDGVEYWVRS